MKTPAKALPPILHALGAAEVRQLEAAALEGRGAIREQLLDAIAVVEEDAERHGDDELASRLRQTAAIVRDRRNDLAAEARALRTAEL